MQSAVDVSGISAFGKYEVAASNHASLSCTSAQVARQYGIVSASEAATQATLWATKERLDREASLAQLMGTSNTDALSATVRLINELTPSADVGGLLAKDVVAAEEARLRHLIEDALGIGKSTAATYALDFAQSVRHSEQLRGQQKERFLLLGLAETEDMLKAIRGSHFGQVRDLFGGHLSSTKAAVLAMQTPWLDSSRALHSVPGFSELQAIGHAFSATAPFDEDFSSNSQQRVRPSPRAAAVLLLTARRSRPRCSSRLPPL